MNKVARAGLIILAGSAAALLIQLWIIDNDRSWIPLRAHLPTANGAELIRPFKIAVGGRYFIYAVFKPVGPLKEASEDFLNANRSKGIPCAIWLTISRPNGVVVETMVESLDSAFMTADRLGYGVAEVNLTEEGTYELTIRNQRDLSYLDSTDPELQVQLNAVLRTNSAITRGVVTSLCLAIGILGALLLIIGLVSSRVSKGTH